MYTKVKRTLSIHVCRAILNPIEFHTTILKDGSLHSSHSTKSANVRDMCKSFEMIALRSN